MTAKKTKARGEAVPKGSKVAVFHALRSELESVEPAANVPYIDGMLAEGAMLAENARKYRKELVAVGTSPEAIDSLQQRAEAVAGASILMRRNSRGRWREEIEVDERAIVLVTEMSTVSRFALRNSPEALRVLDAIDEGTGVDDRMSDLRDYADFFTQNAVIVAKTGVDPKALATEALEVEAKLAILVRDRRLRDAGAPLDTRERDRAIAHLAAGMREVRDGGTFAFRNQPGIARLFRAILPKRPARRKKPAAPMPTPDE